MGVKFNWGNALMTAGQGLGRYAEMLRQEQALEDERAYREGLLEDERAYQEGLWEDRRQASLEDYGTRLEMAQAARDAADPYVDELIPVDSAIPFTGGLSMADMGAANPVLGATQQAAAMGAPLRQSQVASMLQQYGNAIGRSQANPPAPPKPASVGDDFMLGGVVTPEEEWLYPDLEGATRRNYAGLLAAGYPDNIQTMQLAEDAAREEGAYTPSFGMAYDPATGMMYDPSLYEVNSGSRSLFGVDWLNRDADPSIDPIKGLTPSGLAEQRANPPVKPMDFYNNEILPLIRNGYMTKDETRRWAESHAFPDDLIKEMIKDAPEERRAAATVPGGNAPRLGDEKTLSTGKIVVYVGPENAPTTGGWVEKGAQ